MVFSPALRVLPRSMRPRSAWLTGTSTPLTVTVAESRTSPRLRYAPSEAAQVDGSVTVVVYVPIPEAWERSTGAVMARHDGSLPSSPAVRATVGWSVFVVVYWFAPGV